MTENATPIRPRATGTEAPTPARGHPNEIWSTLLELTGISLLSVGCWIIAPYVGLIVLGLCMVLLGVAMGWQR